MLSVETIDTVKCSEHVVDCLKASGQLYKPTFLRGSSLSKSSLMSTTSVTNITKQMTCVNFRQLIYIFTKPTMALQKPNKNVQLESISLPAASIYIVSEKLMMFWFDIHNL